MTMLCAFDCRSAATIAIMRAVPIAGQPGSGFPF